VRAEARSFHLLIGVGDIDDDMARRAVQAGRERLADLTSRDPVGGRS
jgi:starch synthase